MKKKYLLFIVPLAALAIAVLFFLLPLSSKISRKPPRIFEERGLTREIPSLQAQKCGECHRASFEEWRDSQHARANQSVDPDKFAKLPGHPVTPRHPAMQIGLEPLIQYLIPMEGGRFQVYDWAYDPKVKEWFYVFEGEPRKEGEWGHWKGRGMNWNSQCAVCHMTGFEKGYDPEEDRYHSTWDAMGISCVQCHGGMSDHPKTLSPEQTEAGCASCHSRREELHGGFAAGDSFSDFFRLMLPDQTELFYPDGQAKGEIFEYNSFQLSPMAQAGVTCLDCHNPHSGKLKLPVENNALCLSCHRPPGLRGAIPIDPLAHSHHPPESPGNQCVNCHMPAKPYMVRDLRRDHRFSIPDPLLTKKWGIPNACNACHQDRSIAWAIQKTHAWYGEKMDRRSRRRTEAIAQAQSGDPKVGKEILRLARAEDNPAWRATLIAHLSPWLGAQDVHDFVVKSLQHPSPWVRSAAINVLQGTPEDIPALEKLNRDPSRLVRLDALWASAIRGHTTPQEKAELLAYLNDHADQPTGALKLAQFALAGQKLAEAVEWLQKAIRWDPGSAYPQYLMGRALYELNRLQEARPFLEKAIHLDPNNFDYSYNLALLLGELGEPQASRRWLEKTIRLSPNFGRAWYNLGVAYLQGEQIEKAMSALERAEALLPLSPDPPRILAEIYRRKGSRKRASEKLKKAERLKEENAR